MTQDEVRKLQDEARGQTAQTAGERQHLVTIILLADICLQLAELREKGRSA